MRGRRRGARGELAAASAIRTHAARWVAALAAVVITSALRLSEFADLSRIRRMQAWEFSLTIACLAGVVALGPIPGIGLAVVLAVIELQCEGRRPHFAVLGRVVGLWGYHDVARCRHARRVPGLLLLRWDAPLFFANAEWFQRSVLRAVDAAPDAVRRVVVAAEPVRSIDATSADMLRDLVATLRAAGVELHFAEMKDPVKDKIGRFELSSEFPAECFHPTVGAAVDDYLADHGVAWTP